MCGIVGYVGKEVIETRLMDGLQHLEYRGYDSAGMALCTESGQLHVLKKAGNLSHLQAALPEFRKTIQKKVVGGIAHTRWATHGKPTEMNAHPHLSPGDATIAVVHNGIIENYTALKEILQKKGYVFVSETDTEVLAHLIKHHYQGNLFSAVSAALEYVEGTYGIAVLSSQEPGVLVAARKSSPLIVGLTQNGKYVASDVTAVVKETRQVVHLDEYDVALLSENDLTVINLKRSYREPAITTVDFQKEEISKGAFEHFMLKEIYDQPESIRNTIRGRLVEEYGCAKLSGLNGTPHEWAQISRIIIVACGTSRFAGMVGEYILEQVAGIPVEIEYASEFRYRNPVLPKDTVVFAISQSGETADTLAALREAKLKGATVFGVVNSVASAIAREAERGIYLHAGPEISVASTKAFTCQIMALCLLALMLGRSRRVSLMEGRQIIQEINQVPEQVASILTHLREPVRKLARYLKKFEHVFYIGRSYNYPVALEGALKLKEISYIHAEGYEAAELKHGPLALLGRFTPVIALMNHQAGYDKVVSSAKEILARDAPLIGLGTEGDDHLKQLTSRVLWLPACPEYLSPILNGVVLQLLAYEVALAKGLNVDQPRHLAKSVTVE